ncbi:MAG: ATP-dependent helicase HrpB [Deltaproteobacteria bacterium]|nr:ATP-dependent helicase HrpB [Deltaproteobacteria bacterium]
MDGALPIDAVLPELVEALQAHRAAVLTAPAGAGKSTRVPLALLSAGLAGEGAIWMLQPRRIAARAVARRMAGLLGEAVGQTVGFQVRFERCASRQTRILVLTEGVLTRRLVRDPFCEGTGLVVLDEFHERSLHADLALAMLRQVMAVRDDLRLLVMSATLDAAPVQGFLGGCPHVDCALRQHALAIEHIAQPDERPLAEQLRSGLVRLEAGRDEGCALVFLSGAGEIRRAAELLDARPLPGSPELLTLHGGLSAEEQDRALRPARRARVVLATNIAETSLTVPGTTAVLDSGWVKRLRQDPSSGLDRLRRERVSRASAAQRAGRAGRLGPGRALRLWTASEHAGLLEAETPEIARADLAGALLSVLAFQPGDPREFCFFEPPDVARLELAWELLRSLGALEPDGHRLSELGQALLALPLHPRLGCLLERGRRAGLADEAARLAALLQARDLLRPDAPMLPSAESDPASLVELQRELAARSFDPVFARAHGLDPRAGREAERAREQLVSTITAAPPAEPPRDPGSALRRCLLAAFPDRVCRRRGPGHREAVMVGGAGLRLDERSGVRSAPIFIAIQARAARPGPRATGRVQLACAVTREDLEAVFPDGLRVRSEAIFDPSAESVVGVRRVRFADLVIEEQLGVPIEDAHEASRLLAAHARQDFERVFRPAQAAACLIGRLRFASSVLPELGWPSVDPASLASRLDALCAGRRSFAELRKIDWRAVLASELDFEHRKVLDAEAPEWIRLPGGQRARIDYSACPEGPPVLAVRLQLLFGLPDGPRIGRGRVPLQLHLLAPSGRPIQITSDLASFWARGYAGVRRELRGRYPKHAWPEDPLGPR